MSVLYKVGSRHKTCGASFRPQQPAEVSNGLISFSGMRTLKPVDLKTDFQGTKLVSGRASIRTLGSSRLHPKSHVPTALRISSNKRPSCGRTARSSLHSICFLTPPRGLQAPRAGLKPISLIPGPAGRASRQVTDAPRAASPLLTPCSSPHGSGHATSRPLHLAFSLPPLHLLPRRSPSQQLCCQVLSEPGGTLSSLGSAVEARGVAF